MESKRRNAPTPRLRQELPVSPKSYPSCSNYKSAYIESDTDISSPPDSPDSPDSPAVVPSKRRTSSLEGLVSSDETSSPISERAKRAKRRASSGYEADSGVYIKPAIISNDSRVSTSTRRPSRVEEPLLRQSSNVETRAQRRKRELVGSSSSEDVPIRKSSLLRRRNAPDFPRKKVKFSSEAVNKALEDARAAEFELSPHSRRHSISPTVENNIFARQASLSNLSDASLILTPSPLKSRKFANQRSPTDAYIRSRYNWGDSSPVDEHVHPKGSLAHFTRRLSAHAQALREKHYDTLESDDSEPRLESPPRVADISTLSAVQDNIASMLEEMIAGIAQKHRDRNAAENRTEKPSWDDEDRMRNEMQRLATLIATQPPTAPAPAQSAQEIKDTYRMMEAIVLNSVQGAHQMYQNLFRHGQLPTQEELMKLVVDGAGNFVAPRDKWLIIQHQERPDLFFSTVSWADEYWHRDPFKRLNESEMLHVLMADEVRYRQAYKSCVLHRWLMNPKKPRPEHSSYPYYNMRQREHAIQQQQTSSAPGVLYLKAHVANQSSGVQPVVIEQDGRLRQSSWKMDVDDNYGRNTRAHNDHTWRPPNGVNFAPTHRFWTPVTGISFAPLPEIKTAQGRSSNKNMCPHFARGNCKFGKDCKKSHDTSKSDGQNGPVSDKTKKVSELLIELFDYLNALDRMPPGQLERGDTLNYVSFDIENRVDALGKAVTFTNGHDLLHTNFTHDRVLNAVVNFRTTWRNVAGDLLMPKELASALRTLDQAVSEARQKISQAQINRPTNNFSSDNVFQQGGNGRQNNQNVSNNNGGGKNQKGGNNGGNQKYNKNNNNNNNAKNGQNGRNGKNGKAGNSVTKTGNLFHMPLQLANLNNANALLHMSRNKDQSGNKNKKNKSQGSGNRGGRRGK